MLAHHQFLESFVGLPLNLVRHDAEQTYVSRAVEASLEPPYQSENGRKISTLEFALLT